LYRFKEKDMNRKTVLHVFSLLTTSLLIALSFASIKAQAKAEIITSANASKLISIMTLSHTDYVSDLAFNADGSLLATGARDGTVTAWAVATGEKTAAFKGHDKGKGVSSIVFSPDGKRLASTATDKTVRIWDTRTGEEVLVIKDPKTSVTSLAFAPDGKQLVGSLGQTLQLWDAASGKPSRKALTGHKGGVVSVAFSPDGAKLISASTDKTVKLWDVKTGRAGASVEPQNGTLTHVVFNADGSLFASVGGDCVTLWDAKTSKAVSDLKCPIGLASPRVAFSPDGSLLASGSGDAAVRLWDVKTGEELALLRSHLGSIERITFSPDGTMLASASSDKTVQLWTVGNEPAPAFPSGTMTGRVEIDDKPQKNLIVTFYRDKRNGPQYKTKTDADGVFRLEGIAPGNLVVSLTLLLDGSKRCSASLPGSYETSTLSLTARTKEGKTVKIAITTLSNEKSRFELEAGDEINQDFIFTCR
jgi:WD40 repeat protein